MAGRSPRSPTTAHGLGAALGLIGLLFFASGLIVAATIMDNHSWTPLYVTFPLLAWVYCAAGLVAWWRRPSNRFGMLLIVAAASWLGLGLAGTGVPALVAVGLVVASAPLAVCTHLVHAFPSGRLHGASVPIVVAGYVVSLVMQAPLYLFSDASAPDDVLTVTPSAQVLTATRWVQGSCGALVMLATTVVLLRRLREANPAQRRVLGPVWGFGIFAVLMVPISAHVFGPLVQLSPPTIDAVQGLVFAGIPVAFVLGLLRGGFGRTGEIQELGAWLAAGPGTRPALTQALATTLGDPSLQLWFWLPHRGRYVDGDGADVVPLSAGDHRGLVEVEASGNRVGAIVYDATLLDDPELVQGAGQVVALALERERLTAELLGAREELRRTLARMVASEDRERRRIARDLHDGLQSRLVLLGAEAFLIGSDPTASASVRQAADKLRSGLDDSAGQLRRLVHGVMPAVLVERGLYAAVQDLVAELPIPATVSLRSEDRELPPAIEHAAYLAVTEVVTNTLKHARATQVSVSLEHAQDGLRVTVCDDGVGGAATNGVGGLTGLADRFAALGGRVSLVSPTGGGTTVSMEAPC